MQRHHCAEGHRVVRAHQGVGVTVRAHRDLFEAVKARDAALAKQLLSQHFRNIERRFQQAIASLAEQPLVGTAE